MFSYHGLIASRHGLVNAVDALAKLRREVPGARLQILGSGDGLAELRARVDELGLTDAVSLPDHVLPITEMPAVLEQAHFGVVPEPPRPVDGRGAAHQAARVRGARHSCDYFP